MEQHWLHFAARVDVHIHMQACTHTHADQYAHTYAEANTEWIKYCIYNLGYLQFVMQPKKDNWGNLPVCK